MPKQKNSVIKSLPKISVKAPKLDLAKETKRGIAVVVFLALALISAISLIYPAGTLGTFIRNSLAWSFGVIAYFVPLLFLLVSVSLFRQDLKAEQDSHFYFRTYFGILLLAGSIAGIIHMGYMWDVYAPFELASQGRAGGYLGALFSAPAYQLMGFTMGVIALCAIVIIGVLITFNVPLHFFAFWKKFKTPQEGETAHSGHEIKINSLNRAEDEGFVREKVVNKNTRTEAVEQEEKVEVIQSSKVGNLGDAHAPKLEAIVVEDRKDWKLPPFDLLDDNKQQVDSGNIEMNVSVIQKTLKDFNIEVEMGEVNVGPTVTQYTLRPAQGVKLAQIGALQNDLALALSAHSLRMELPIPGKPLVGIEVPNKSTAIVRLREVMQTPDFIDHKSRLAFSLGRDVAGKPMIADLAKMPHLLIAGATGTGKSVSINSLFISLLYRNTPQDVKFIVIDPKRVELSLYNGIPHLLTPVITDHEKAVNALKWAVSEMDRRYKLLAEVNKRNIGEYNEQTPNGLSYIVVLVDELADLMAIAQADVEAAVVRLSQMARAVGIHLVLATQSPRTDIITGLIKANITSRIAFAVASLVDSRVILDSSGAEKLLGSGDSLFISAEFNKPKRIQGAYINEKEVKKVVEFFKNQAGAVIYNEEIVEKVRNDSGIPGFAGESGDSDPMLEEAIREVRAAGKASASLLQRRLRLGYARAARILDILEQQGIVGPAEGAKPREVYGAIPASEKAEYGIEEDVQ